jgi:tetratricopeptide (TPR) repeat protein
MVRAAATKKEGLGLYLDVPTDDLEAAALFEKIDLLLSYRRRASRDAPSFVDRKSARSWNAAKRGGSGWASYIYLAFRDLIGQVPVAGPFIKALLPQSLPSRGSVGDSTASLRFLTKRSRSREIFLAIDNVQFLPSAMREILTSELEEAGCRIRLVLIERIQGDLRLEWAPAIPDAELMDVDLKNASRDEVTELVEEIIPEIDDLEEVASATFRRSGGNPKSVWFQLRLIASRRSGQEALPTSYEDVILTLSPLNQAVLRFVAFGVEGLTVANLVSLLGATDLRPKPAAATSAITDLAALGLLVVNGESADRVRVEHELVTQVVTEITPEDEKLKLRAQGVAALTDVIDAGTTPGDEVVLYDRLVQIVNDVELRQKPSLLSHVVQFIQIQGRQEQYGYLSGICRDSACWGVLDLLPAITVRTLLDAIQKSSLFSVGLVTAGHLRRLGDTHKSLAYLYEAKYLVQMFLYEEAATALEHVPESKEKRAVTFNIMLNLLQDEQAAKIAMSVYEEISEETGTEQDYLILRNSAHLFPPEDARLLVEASVNGFQALRRRFAVATGLNNLGIVELASGLIGAAREHFEASRRQLSELGSSEVYQPLVNLSAVALLREDLTAARRFLTLARDAAPSQLLQDSAMLDMNAIALEVCGSDAFGLDVVERMSAVAAAASETRDLRFVDVATWFAECLEAALAERSEPTGSLSQRIQETRESGRVALEIFVARDVGAERLEVPFVLSPHWRY